MCCKKLALSFVNGRTKLVLHDNTDCFVLLKKWFSFTKMTNLKNLRSVWHYNMSSDVSS